MAKLVCCACLLIVLSVISPGAALMWSLAEGQMPMTVYVTSPHDVMPVDMQELWMRNTPLLDGAEVQYYNEDAMSAAVKDISVLLETEADIHGAWEAFQNLRPGAFRADLWRIMMLWAKGGIYLDCDLELQVPITSWLKHSDSTLFLVKDCQDIKGQDGLSWAYWNAMMAATPRHKILEHMIRKIVNRLHAHYYAEDQTLHRPLSITGPRALGMALESYTGSLKTMSQAAVLVSQKRADGRDEPIVQLDGRAIVKHNQAKGLEKDYKLTSAHYDPLFWLHLVYCDEGDLRCTVATQHYLAKEHPRMLAELMQNTTTSNSTNSSTPAAPKLTPEPTPEPTPMPTPEVTPESTPEPTPEVAPEPTPTPTPELTPESTPAPTPKATPELKPEPTPEPTPTPTPEVTPESTPAPTPKATPELRPEPTPAPTPTPTPEVTPDSTPELTPNTTLEVTPESTDMLVSGSMQLTVDDPAAFVASEKAVVGVAKGIAQGLEIPVAFVGVRLSVSSRRLTVSGNLRRLEGGVQVDYTIHIPAEQSAAYDVSDVAKKIEDASKDDAASAVMLNAIQTAVATEDPSLPAITAVSVALPTVTQGSANIQAESEPQAAGLPVVVIVICAAGVLCCIMFTILMYMCFIRKKRASA